MGFCRSYAIRLSVVVRRLGTIVFQRAGETALWRSSVSSFEPKAPLSGTGSQDLDHLLLVIFGHPGKDRQSYRRVFCKSRIRKLLRLPARICWCSIPADELHVCLAWSGYSSFASADIRSFLRLRPPSSTRMT